MKKENDDFSKSDYEMVLFLKNMYAMIMIHEQCI